MKNTSPPIPNGTRRIMRRPDLPQDRAPASFEVRRNGAKPFTINLEKRNRQVIEALMLSPLYCASPIRLSDIVMIVKRDFGLDIVTTFHTEQTGTDRASFGVYSLNDTLSRVQLGGVAA